jgi:hypothetical protein
MGAFALCYNGWYIKFFLPAFYGFYFYRCYIKLVLFSYIKSSPGEYFYDGNTLAYVHTLTLIWNNAMVG